MAKLTLSKIALDVESDASVALTWLTKEGVKLAQGGPRALAALGVLLGAVKQELAAAGSGNLTAAIAEVKPVFSDLEAFVEDFGLKL